MSTRRFAPGEEGDDEEVDREEPKSVWPKKDPRTGGFHPDVLGIEHRERWDRASMAEREEIKTAWTQEKQELELSSKEAPIEEMMNSLVRDPELRDAEISVDDSRITKSQTGWFAEEEDDDFALTPDHEEGNDSDMTSVAHDELALQREIREYARLAAWDMPLLKSMFRSILYHLSKYLADHYTTLQSSKKKNQTTKPSPLSVSAIQPILAKAIQLTEKSWSNSHHRTKTSS